MSISITEMSGVTKAALSGRLDTASVDKLEISFIAGIVPKGQNTIVDLSQVSFIASLGIRMLLSGARALSRQNATMVLYGASDAIMDIIETTALSEIITVVPGEADALAAVAA